MSEGELHALVGLLAAGWFMTWCKLGLCRQDLQRLEAELDYYLKLLVRTQRPAQPGKVIPFRGRAS